MLAQRRIRPGFTLVELLVVIGIIAVLVSILLPAIARARSHANALKCLSNLRQLGLGITQYANRYQGVVIPTFVWGSPTNSDPVTGFIVKDNWAMLLVADGLVPNPNLTPTSDVTAASTVLVCPEVRNLCVDTNVSGVVKVSSSDGFDRRISHYIKPGLIVDYGYGINGATYSIVPDNVPATSLNYNLPSTSISIHPGTICVPPKKMGSIKGSSQMVILYDGFSWNPQANSERISGQRHGRPQRNLNVVSTGITNLLFLDGHAESANRVELPSTLDHVLGTTAQMRSPKYRWNTRHLK
jgi:prepilin-type N-terminal cleavage/methylation domain-containing protein/prepilin-type processing-associated H-X9-DG protein